MTEQITEIDTLVVGAGQAGVAMSEHLTRLDIPTWCWKSRVLPRPGAADAGIRWSPTARPGTIGSRGWCSRTARQTALSAKSRWQTILPPMPAASMRRSVLGWRFSAPNASSDGRAFVLTPRRGIEAQRIVAATGPFQRPVIPAIAPQSQAIQQLHSAHYFNPQQLPEGGVLVIGAGSSGVQIADELQRAGRAVWLSVGAHDRPPRRYRQRDFCWWLGVLGMWDAAANAPGKEHVTIAVSGARAAIPSIFASWRIRGHVSGADPRL